MNKTSRRYETNRRLAVLKERYSICGRLFHSDRPIALFADRGGLIDGDRDLRQFVVGRLFFF
ncbi:MAG: hypothetical protein ACIALR_12095, partial [Blastopirellula sp. JB062]